MLYTYYNIEYIIEEHTVFVPDEDIRSWNVLPTTAIGCYAQDSS